MRLLCGSVQSRLGLETELSQEVGKSIKGRCRARGGRKRGDQSLHCPLQGSSVCHALEKEGVNVKVRAIP